MKGEKYRGSNYKLLLLLLNLCDIICTTASGVTDPDLDTKWYVNLIAEILKHMLHYPLVNDLRTQNEFELGTDSRSGKYIRLTVLEEHDRHNEGM